MGQQKRFLVYSNVYVWVYIQIYMWIAGQIYLTDISVVTVVNSVRVCKVRRPINKTKLHIDIPNAYMHANKQAKQVQSQLTNWWNVSHFDIVSTKIKRQQPSENLPYYNEPELIDLRDQWHSEG